MSQFKVKKMYINFNLKNYVEAFYTSYNTVAKQTPFPLIIFCLLTYSTQIVVLRIVNNYCRMSLNTIKALKTQM